jgi:hypothetical protein
MVMGAGMATPDMGMGAADMWDVAGMLSAAERAMRRGDMRAARCVEDMQAAQCVEDMRAAQCAEDTPVLCVAEAAGSAVVVADAAVDGAKCAGYND